MHELSIAENIVEIALDHLREDGGTSVREIELEIGTLSGIEIDALTFALQSVMETTPLRTAVISLLTVEARSRCDICSVEYSVDDIIQPCPSCGSFDYTILQGEEMRVKSMIIED